MTEAEEARADALDEEYTKNPPAPGPDGTGAFLNLPFGGTGDYTAEKKLLPEWTDEDYEKMMALVIEDAKTRGEA